MSLSLSDAERKTESAVTIDARTLFGLFVFTLLAHGVWYLATNPPTGFADSDGYMRALRVETLWQGGGWFDNSIARANAPYGDTSHWTRPLDVVISLLAGPLVPFLGVKAAIFWGGALSGPVLHGAAAAAFAWAALPLVGRTAATLAAIATMTQFGLISYGAPVRGDHHIFFVFLAALGFGFAIRALDRERAGESSCAGTPTGVTRALNDAPLSGRAADRHAIFAGLAAAGGVWIGIEGFVFAALTLAALGLAWLAGDDPPDAPKGLRFAGGFAAGLAGALAIERGPSVFAVEYDRISIVHLTLGVLVALFFLAVRLGAARGALRSPLARLGAALAGAAAVAGVWVLLFPKSIRGPMADVDPVYVGFILENITELGPGYTLERFPAILGATVLALPWLVWRLWREGREKPGRWFWAWAYVAICIAVFGALTAGWVRWTVYSGLFPCLVLGDMIARLTERIAAQKLKPVWREAGCALVVAFFLLGPLTAAYATAIVVVPPEKKAERERAKVCSVNLLADVLNRPPWSDRPRTVLMGVNYGAEILYRTRHRVVGTPYHRSASGLRETFEAFAAQDDAFVREILIRRDVELIAICPEGKEGLSREKGGFYDRLKTEPPAWVRETALPAEAAAFRLFQVQPGSLAK